MANNFSDAFAAWLFAAGALTTDSIGTNTLTNNGSVASGTAIQGCASVAFNGSSKYFSITDANLQAGFPFKNGDTGKLITVALKLRLVTTNEVPMAGKLAFNTAQSFGLTYSGSPFFERDSGYNNALGLPTFVNGHEYQIIYTINGAGKAYSIYVYDYTAGTAGHIVNLTSSNAWTGSTLAFLIGLDINRNYAYGEMAEVVVFSRILSISEMNAIKDGNYSSSSPGAVTDIAPHDLTSNNSHSPYVASNSGSDANFEAFHAFDGQFDIYHNSAGNTGANYWLKLDIGSGNTKRLWGYSVRVNSYPEPTRAPKNWTMEGSNDNSTWNTLDTRTNESSWGSGEARIYVCATFTGSYRYFRLNISANNGDTGHTQVAELYLFAFNASLYNLTTTVAAVSAASAPIAAIERPLASSPAAVSAVAAPILAITRALQESVAAGSAASAPSLLVLRALISAISGVSDVGAPNLAVVRPLSSSLDAISAVSTPNLAVQRALALLAAVMSEIPDISLLLHGILDLTIAIAAQSQVSNPALNVARPLDSSIAAQAQTSAVALAVLRVLTATIATETQAPDITLAVLRDLATAIFGQSAVSTPVLESICSLITGAHAVTDTSVGALAVLRDLAATIAVQSALSEFDLAMGVPRDLVTAIAALTQTLDIEVILAFYESLLAKAKRHYGPISASDLEAAALQWIETEEEKELHLPGQEYDG